MRPTLSLLLLLLATCCVADRPPAPATDGSGRAAAVEAPLPSWRDGAARRALLEFVQRVTAPDSDDFVPPGERVAVFDNDGTLWCEQPIYTQLSFVLDRVAALAPEHPEWRTTEPFRSVLAGDVAAALAGGEQALLELVAATHAGVSVEQFAAIVGDWIAAARHPRFGRRYTECVYQPQLELLAWLRANGFQTYIVSGGGIEFMRPWTEAVYGIPPAQVVGSSIVTEFRIVDGEPVLLRLPEVAFIDDGAGKPVGIAQHIGRRPILAFGNSGGDEQMLQYTTIGNDRPALGLLLLHDDEDREYAYGPAQGLPDSKVGAFPQSLHDAAVGRGWVVVSMQRDWTRVFPE